MSKIFCFLSAFCLLCLNVVAQTPTKVEILNADVLYFEKSDKGDFTRMVGNCAFKQDNMLMYCDSAYLYNATNSVEGFGNVHIIQADTINLLANQVSYNGDTKKAVAKGNVRLTDKDMELTSNVLDYDMNSRLASYFTGGTVKSKDNILTSQYGYYYAKTRDAFFKKKVVLVNPDYKMKSDTLQYNVKSKLATIFGPTTITNKTDYIYVEEGSYDTKADVAKGGKNSYLRRESQIIKGDKLYYNRKTGYGTARYNVQIIDTVQKSVITGQFAEYFRKNSKAYVTENPVLMNVMDNGKDTLYIGADTLRTFSDSIGKNRTVLAYKAVRIFSKNMQGKCDSLAYKSVDSTLRCYINPVLWADSSQLTADSIIITLKNKKINTLNMYNTALVINQDDSNKYNQVKGKNMYGNFVDNKLVSMRVEGNGQSIYYAKEDNGTYIGVNVAKSSNILLKFKDNKAQRISFITQPEAIFYPIEEAVNEVQNLSGFAWYQDLKPKNKQAVERSK